MRKFLTMALWATIAVPAIAQAQTQTRELAQDRRDIREEEHELHRAVANAAPTHVIRNEARDVASARQEYREDLREVKRDYRHRGDYRTPRGYREHAYRAGDRFDHVYLGRHYRLDPVAYRLPRVGHQQEWIRHNNDLLLVNVRTQRVVDVRHAYFW